MAEKKPIDTANRFGVARRAENTVILLPETPGQPLTAEEALQLAAWLVAVNAERMDDFDNLLGEVLNT